MEILSNREKKAFKQQTSKFLLDHLENLFMWIFRRNKPKKEKPPRIGGRFGGGGASEKW